MEARQRYNNTVGNNLHGHERIMPHDAHDNVR